MKILLYNTGYFEGVDGTLLKYITKKAQAVLSNKHKKNTAMKLAEHVHSEKYEICMFVESKADHHEIITQHTQYNGHFDTKYHPESLLQKTPFFRGNGNSIISKQQSQNTSKFFKKRNQGGLFSAKKLFIEHKHSDGTLFVLVHSPLGKRARTQQYSELVELYKKYTGALVILGDFNIFSGFSELNVLTLGLGLKILSPGYTFPAHKPEKALDLFLVRGINNPKVSIKKIDDFSDHLGVVLEYS